MIYKNSIKVMMSNFTLVSKILMFMVLHFAIVFGISYMFLLPILELLSNQGLFANAQSFYMDFLQNLNLQQAFSNLSTLLNSFVEIITTNFSSIGFYVIALLFTLIVLGAYFNNFYSLIVTNSLYFSMSNNIKFKFAPSFVSTLLTNLKYSLFSLFVKLPVTIIILSLVVLSFQLLTVGGAVTVFAPLLIILIYLILNAVKLTVFYGWSPSIVVFDKGIFNALDKSFKITMRKLKKVFANSFYMVLTIFVVNVFAAIVTFGASLVLTLPMSILLINAFSMVVFYSNYGMRYYVDEFNVIVPVKLERTEPFCSIKFII